MISSLHTLRPQVERLLQLCGLKSNIFLLPGILGTLSVVLRLAVFGLFIPLIHLLFTDGKSDGLGKFSFLLSDVVGDNPIPAFIVLLAIAATARSTSSYYARTSINTKVIEAHTKIGNQLVQRFTLFGQHFYNKNGYLKNVKKLDKLPKKPVKGFLSSTD